VIVGGISAPTSSGVGVREGTVKIGSVGVAVGLGVHVCTPLDGCVGVRDGWTCRPNGVLLAVGSTKMNPNVGVGVAAPAEGGWKLENVARTKRRMADEVSLVFIGPPARKGTLKGP
jgi:hypothetical protein